MFLYKQYCYDTLPEVMDSIYSELYLPNGWTIDAVTNPINDDVRIDYNYVNDSGTTITGNRTVTFPTCEQVGFDNSFTGITIEDSVDLAWLCISAIVLAWGIAQLKTTANL